MDARRLVEKAQAPLVRPQQKFYGRHRVVEGGGRRVLRRDSVRDGRDARLHAALVPQFVPERRGVGVARRAGSERAAVEVDDQRRLGAEGQVLEAREHEHLDRAAAVGARHPQRQAAALIASIRARNAASCTGVGAFAGNGQPTQPRLALSALSPTRISGWRQSGTGAGSGSSSVMFASPALSTPSTQARSRARRT